ncbi:MAG: sugar ABC transporter permease [Psychrilyobacter sp.]|uniref:extracellular solute-binding protein n=1 Tax=Psychrilyobacter sp. TaxID=2586924 RepID=UPI003C781FE2
MNKKLRKVFILSSLMVAMVGCGSDEAKTTKTETPKTLEKLSGSLVTRDPLELTMHMHFRNKYVYEPNGLVGKEASRLTNIVLKETASKVGTNSDEMFNLMMVSGKLPDIVGGNNRKDDFIKYGMEGAFVPLNKLIDQYAPHIKKFLEERPDVKNSIVAPDGEIYYIPYIADGAAARGYWIRQDWLDKLGLEQPNTVEDFHKVLVAFRDQDPNGNGLKDEVPLFFRHWQELMRLTTLWGARSTGTDTYLSFYEKEGKVISGLTQPEFKDGMKHVVKWYKEGLIDPEVFTRGSKAREVLFGNNIGGATRDWFASTGNFNSALKDKISGFNVQVMAPPMGTTGKRVEESMRASVKPDGWAMTFENKHQAETMKYFDFYFTDEGRKLANFGVEGVHYTMKGGKPQFTDEVLHSEKAVNQRLWEDGAQIPIGFQMDYNYEKQWTNADALKGVEMYTKNNYILKEYVEPTLTPEERLVYDQYWPGITTYMTESIQNWVLKGMDIDKEWDTYINNLNQMGLPKVLEVIQKANDRREEQSKN